MAPSGTDSNPGTLTSPTTLAAAITRVTAGGVIYLRNSTYNLATTITIERTYSGTAGVRKQIVPYNNEKPVLDFSAQTFLSSNRGIQLYGHYWHMKGLGSAGCR